jgi:hypothetical protein
MLYFLLKSALSGLIIALVSEVAKRSPGLGALIVSLPLISILAMIWLWRETGDTVRVASHVEATFWYVIPSLPMFLLMPALLRHGVGFWASLVAGCTLTIVLYALTVMIAGKFGIRL